jgi:hypothetical protein
LVSKSQEILFARQLRDLPGFRQYFYSLYAWFCAFLTGLDEIHHVWLLE